MGHSGMHEFHPIKWDYQALLRPLSDCLRLNPKGPKGVFETKPCHPKQVGSWRTLVNHFPNREGVPGLTKAPTPCYPKKGGKLGEWRTGMNEPHHIVGWLSLTKRPSAYFFFENKPCPPLPSLPKAPEGLLETKPCHPKQNQMGHWGMHEFHPIKWDYQALLSPLSDCLRLNHVTQTYISSFWIFRVLIVLFYFWRTSNTRLSPAEALTPLQ